MAPPAKEVDALLPEGSFAEVKSHLSEWMTEVVRERRPLVVDRNRGRDRAVLVDERDLSAILESFTFNPQVSASDGGYVVRLPEFNLIAGGADLDQALAEAVDLADVYVGDYLERVGFYMQTDRRTQWPWVVRFALTPGERRRELISGEGEERAQAHQAR